MKFFLRQPSQIQHSQTWHGQQLTLEGGIFRFCVLSCFCCVCGTLVIRVSADIGNSCITLAVEQSTEGGSLNLIWEGKESNTDCSCCWVIWLRIGEGSGCIFKSERSPKYYFKINFMNLLCYQFDQLPFSSNAHLHNSQVNLSSKWQHFCCVKTILSFSADNHKQLKI